MPAPFGMHGRIVAQPCQGDQLAEMLLEAARGLEPNRDCLLYVVSRSLGDSDSVWVTEVWRDRDAHAASLQDAAARALIERARPLIAEFADRAEFRPEGGKGLPPHSS
jgi:quinol monooxygenase YgiN